jgi:hypothetical protein
VGGLLLIEILAFLAGSYYLFALGYLWNYALFPLGVMGIFTLRLWFDRR